MSERVLTFWHVAGDIIWRANGRPMAIHEIVALGLRETFEDAARAGWRARDIKAARRAAALYVELTNALDALAQWKLVVGRSLAPMESVAEPLERVLADLAERMRAA